MIKIYLIFLFIILSARSYASSCCGGGGSSSMIITADNKMEMSLGYSFRKDIGLTNSQGYSSLNSEQIRDESQNVDLGIHYQLLDYWQLASRVSLKSKDIKKSGKSESETGLSDIDIQASYEYLPEFNYSLWKPRGFLYSKLSIPTSKSLYDSQTPLFTDVRGAGLYSFSVGHFHQKKWGEWTVKLSTEVSHFFGKKYSNLKLEDYHKLLVPMGVSYAPENSDFSFGVNDTFTYQTPKKTTGTISSTSQKEYFWELGFFVNYMQNREAIWSLSYSDSSLVGKSINSPLYRTVSLSYAYSVEI
jgi:hypothetical protein